MVGPTPKPISERLLARIERLPWSGCWIWTGYCYHTGYGMFSLGRIRGTGKQRFDGAHRVSYRAFVGDIPNGMHVCHQCDVRECVNPDHLFLGTFADNMRDKAEKGRQAWGERNHSKLTEQDVLAIRSASGTIADIAKLFGVSNSTVQGIRSRRSWSRLERRQAAPSQGAGNRD